MSKVDKIYKQQKEEEKHQELRSKLASILNQAHRENVSDTPDFILAEYMLNCLAAAETFLAQRDRYYGVHVNIHAEVVDGTKDGLTAMIVQRKNK